MALIYCDGFDSGDQVQRYIFSTGTGSTTTSTRFGQGKALRHASSISMTRNIPALSMIYMGFAVSIDQSSTGGRLLTLAGDTGTTVHIFISMVSPGIFTLYRGDSVALGTFSMATGTWNYLEIAVSISDTTGTAVVRVNGAEVANYSGDTRNGGTNTTIDSFSFSRTGAGTLDGWLDDLYICDGTGTVNNGLLGEIRVQTLYPTAAGSSTQFTPTSGANYVNVSDVPDVTTTYNYASTVGFRDTYTMGDTLANTGTVLGVQENIHAWKSDTGTGSIKTALKSGASVYNSPANTLGTSVAYYGQMRETNPATAAAWTKSDVDSLEFGAEVA